MEGRKEDTREERRRKRTREVKEKVARKGKKDLVKKRRCIQEDGGKEDIGEERRM